MSFYVSESLKGLISEEDLLKDKNSVDVKLSDNAIVAKLNDHVLDVISIDCLQYKVTTIVLDIPNNTEILKQLIKFKDNYKFSIFINDKECYELIKYKDGDKLKLLKIEQLARGNNYIVTIIIENV